VAHVLAASLMCATGSPAQTPARPAAPATVSGRIVTPDGRALHSGAVIMIPAAGVPLASQPSDEVRFLPDGSFTFRPVAPGSYQIRARGQLAPDGLTYFAGYRLRVDGRDIHGLHLVLRPGATVSGRIAFDPAGSPSPGAAALRVRVPFVDGSSFADALTGLVGADGHFQVNGVMPGEHFVAVDGLAAPWTVKQALWRGLDLSDVALDMESGERIDDVRVVLSREANTIGGTVRDQSGRPVEHATVVITPDAFKIWLGASRRFALLKTDASGQYRHRGLPPGRYRVLATVELDATAIHASERLKNVQAVSVTFGELEHRIVDLTLPPASSPPSSPAR
jgi:protocatechuate 3,4-dioxygenase beta subunit